MARKEVLGPFETPGNFAIGVAATGELVVDDAGIRTTSGNNLKVPDVGLVVRSDLATPAGGTAGAGVMFGTTSNLGIFFGSGAPTLSAAQGSLYIRTDGSSTSTRAYVNTNGTTGWAAITTAS